jgi:hypothetical protein
MQPGWLNKICAHPVAVSWVLGACGIDVPLMVSILRGGSLRAIVADWQVMLVVVLVLIPASGLGLIIGMFTCWPWMRIICSRYNAAPLKVGDHVMILSGPQKGKIVRVYEITVGQGGWELARLDLSAESNKDFRDIFEEYSVLKLKTK